MSEQRPAPRLRTVDRSQVIPSMPLEDLLDTDHQARHVGDFCSRLDLAPLYDKVRSRGGGPGPPAIDPRICVASWLYATLEGGGHARAPGVALLQPQRFPLAGRRRRQQDLVDLNRVAIDGMRVRASAGTASFCRKQTLEEPLQEAKDQVTKARASTTDPAASVIKMADGGYRRYCPKLCAHWGFPDSGSCRMGGTSAPGGSTAAGLVQLAATGSPDPTAGTPPTSSGTLIDFFRSLNLPMSR
jgi:hypothetical protein